MLRLQYWCGLNYDSELVFLDEQNRVLGIIPLEYLKFEGLFDGLVEQHLISQ